MKTLYIDNTNVYPLYSFDLYEDPVLDHKTKLNFYEVIVTKWTDRTASAKEINHKRYYFLGKYKDIREYLNKAGENGLQAIYNHNKNARFKVEKLETYKINRA